MDSLAGEAIRTRLLLICRAELDWTHGTSDPPLGTEAALDAELAGASLPEFQAIVASPLRATEDTARAILQQRPVAVYWRDDLDEIRTASPPATLQAHQAWLDRLFESYEVAADGESLLDGAERLTAALRAVGDRFYGRTTLVISHPVILTAFRAALTGAAATREQVEALPPLALAVVDYVDGRFYLVEDFPSRQA